MLSPLAAYPEITRFAVPRGCALSKKRREMISSSSDEARSFTGMISPELMLITGFFREGRERVHRPTRSPSANREQRASGGCRCRGESSPAL